MHELNSLVLHWKKMKAEGFKMTDDRYVTEFTLSEQVPPEVVQFTYLVADHCEMTWGILDLSRKIQDLDVDADTENHGRTAEGLASQAIVRSSSDEPPPSKKPRVEPPSPAFPDVVERISKSMVNLRVADLGVIKQKTLKDWLEFFAEPDSILTKSAVLNAMKLFLQLPSRWVYYSDRSVRPKFQRVMKEEGKMQAAAGFCSLVAGVILEKLFLGKVVFSAPAPGAGNPVVYFVKKSVSEKVGDATAGAVLDPDGEYLRHTLGQLGITQLSTPSLVAYVASTAENQDKTPKDAPSVAWGMINVSAANEVLCDLGVSPCPIIASGLLNLDMSPESRPVPAMPSVGERREKFQKKSVPDSSSGGSETFFVEDNDDCGYATALLLLSHYMPSHPHAEASVQQLRDLHAATALQQMGLSEKVLVTDDSTGLDDDAQRDIQAFIADHAAQVPDAEELRVSGDLVKAVQAVCEKIKQGSDSNSPYSLQDNDWYTLGLALKVNFLLHNLPDTSRPQPTNATEDGELELHLVGEVKSYQNRCTLSSELSESAIKPKPKGTCRCQVQLEPRMLYHGRTVSVDAAFPDQGCKNAGCTGQLLESTPKGMIPNTVRSNENTAFRASLMTAMCSYEPWMPILGMYP